MDKNTISHEVDMAKGCHLACSLVTSLCHIHLMGYYVFVHQPCGLAIVFYDRQNNMVPLDSSEMVLTVHGVWLEVITMMT